MPGKRVEWWTIWWSDSVCSKHRTLAAAERAAMKCEARCGIKHWIVKVEFIQRSKRPGAK